MALWLFGPWDVQHPDDTHLEGTGLAFLHPSAPSCWLESEHGWSCHCGPQRRNCILGTAEQQVGRNLDLEAHGATLAALHDRG